MAMDAALFESHGEQLRDVLLEFASDDLAVREKATLKLRRELLKPARFLTNMALVRDTVFEGLLKDAGLKGNAVELLRELRPFAQAHKVRLFASIASGTRASGDESASREVVKRMLKQIRDESTCIALMNAIAERARAGEDVVPLIRDAYTNTDSPEEEALIRMLSESLESVTTQMREWRMSPAEARRLLQWRQGLGVLETPAFDALLDERGVTLGWTSVRGRGWVRTRDGYPMLELTVLSKGREILRGSLEVDDVIRMAAAVLERVATIAEQLTPSRDALPPSSVLAALGAMGRLREAMGRVGDFLDEFDIGSDVVQGDESRSGQR